jgi:hypothetical protein
MVLLIIACSTGIFCGLYYKFLVLIPLTLVTAIACSTAAALHGQSISASLLVTVIPAVGLQGGYMIGLTGRDRLSQLLSHLSPVNSERA